MKLQLKPLSRDKSDTLLLLATCVLVLAPHALRLPLWTSLLCALLIVWRGWITFQGYRMPSRWVLLPIACGAILAGYITHKSLFGRDAGVTMLVLLLVLKLLEMRARRDLFTVMFVSLFLILANFFYTQSILMALLMGLTVVAVLTTQMSFQYTGLVPPLRRRLAQGGMIMALALPVTLVLFLLFPRIQGPLWNMPNDSHAGRTGLSETMAPGNIAELAGSDEVAFRVTFSDPVPPQSRLYWRGLVLTEFDGRSWTQPTPRIRRRMPEVGWRGTPVRYQITQEPSGRPWLFALDLPQQIPVLNDISTGLSTDFQLLAARALDERVRYDVSSILEFDLQPNLPPAVLAQWLALPAGLNPATLAWGAQLKATSADDLALINTVLQHFRQQQFRYTLTPPLLPGQNSVDDFLFTTRAGFCEHYAGAFVVLMRAAGIPARVVTGYQGGELNPVDGYMTVRQSDAHAWAEAWLAGRGWMRVDPTAAIAPERVEKSLRSILPRKALGGLLTLDLTRDSVLGRLRYNWDAVNNQWNQLVLNYSIEKQKELLRSLGFASPDWSTLAALMFALGSLVMAAVVLPLLWNRRNVDPATQLYQRLCRDFARRGLARAPYEGPRAYAARLAADQSILTPANKLAAARFLALYEALLYAPPQTAAAPISELKNLLADCR